MTTKKIWALVADGSKARIVKNIGHELGTEILDMGYEPQKQQDIMADKAGRSFASAGRRRSPMELKSDPVRDAERSFAVQLNALLETHLRSDDLDSLIVTAEPQMLGDLRQAFSGDLKKIIEFEADKNLTGLPDKELLEAISKLTKVH